MKNVVKVVMPIYAPAVRRVIAGGTRTASSMVLVIADTPPFIAKILRRTRGGIGRGPEISEMASALCSRSESLICWSAD